MQERDSDREVGRSGSYSAADYETSLELIRCWRLQLVQFNPAGLPGYQRILDRSYRDDGVRTKLEAARADRVKVLCGVGIVRRGGRNRGYLPSDFDNFLEVVRTSPCRSKNEFQRNSGSGPGVPSWNVAERYAARDADFKFRFEAALAARGWQKGANFYKTPAGSAAQAAKQIGRYGYTQEVRDHLLDLIASGTSIVDALKIEGMPAYNTVVKWRNRDAEFKRRLGEAKAASRALTADQRKEAGAARSKRAGAARPVYQSTVLRGQLLHDALYAAADSAVNRGLPDHVRDDIKSDLIEAVLLGEFPLEEMPLYVREYTAAHNRRQGTFTAWSLDQTLNDDSDMTFVDRLTTDDASNYAD
jgi:hypothetical protein